MAGKVKWIPPKGFKSSYCPYDVAAGINEHYEGVQSGEFCGVDELAHIFAWMPGNVNAWYGHPNDGKGTMLDFLSVLRMKLHKKKKASFRQEDMDTIINDDGKPEIKANRIYKNLAWTYSGKTWNKNYAAKWHVSQMTLEEEMEVMKFIKNHYYAINPRDRRWGNILTEFLYMYEYFGCTEFDIDPFNTVILPDGRRDDQILVELFIEAKEFIQKVHGIMNLVSHAGKIPGGMKEGKAKDSPYKVVTGEHQLGGSAWSIKMDGEYSTYRHERHLELSSKKVTFINLKQRAAEIVGVDKGEYDKIIFAPAERGYYFNGYNPMNGKMSAKKAADSAEQKPLFNDPSWKQDSEPFGGKSKQPEPKNNSTDDLPF